MTAPNPVDDTAHEPLTFRSYQTEVGFVRWAHAQIEGDPLEDERWIFENPNIIGSIRRGRDQLARGEKVRRSFFHLAKDD